MVFHVLLLRLHHYNLLIFWLKSRFYEISHTYFWDKRAIDYRSLNINSEVFLVVPIKKLNKPPISPLALVNKLSNIVASSGAMLLTTVWLGRNIAVLKFLTNTLIPLGFSLPLLTTRLVVRHVLYLLLCYIKLSNIILGGIWWSLARWLQHKSY